MWGYICNKILLGVYLWLDFCSFFSGLHFANGDNPGFPWEAAQSPRPLLPDGTFTYNLHLKATPIKMTQI